MKFQKTIILLFLLFLGACTKKSTPENALADFINYRFTGGQEKGDLLEMTEGPLKEKIESLEEKALASFLNAKELKKRKLKVLIKSCEEERCYLTYVLNYSQGTESPKEFGVEVKKIAQLERFDKTWKITDVSNVKTYIEGRKDLKVSAEGESEAP